MEVKRQARSMMTVIIALLASGAIAVSQQNPLWEDMQRDIEAKLDQQLERISNFEALDARFRVSIRRSAAPTEQDRVDSSPALSLAANGMPAAVGSFIRFYSRPGRSFYENGTQRLSSTCR